MPRAGSRGRRAFQTALRRVISANARWGRHRDYGLRVVSFSRDLRQADVAFAFLAGGEYCCEQEGCHIPFWDPEWWRALRKELAREGVTPPRGMTLHVAVLAEPGALFGPGVRAAPSDGFFYECTWEEATERTSAS